MTDAQKLKETVGYCGIVGSKVLSHEYVSCNGEGRPGHSICK